MGKRYLKVLLFFVLFVGLTIPVPAEEGQDMTIPERPALTGLDLYTALEQRKTTRKYKPAELSTQELSAILWAANGVNRPDGKRTAPSAHGKQYMDIYLVGAKGAYLYDPPNNKLKKITAANFKDKVAKQDYVATASHVLILVADLDKMSSNSNERKLNLANCTAGAICQNVYLMSAAKGVGTCLVASLNEDEIRKGLKLTSSQTPLYIMPLGYPEK